MRNKYGTYDVTKIVTNSTYGSFGNDFNRKMSLSIHQQSIVNTLLDKDFTIDQIKNEIMDYKFFDSIMTDLIKKFIIENRPEKIYLLACSDLGLL